MSPNFDLESGLIDPTTIPPLSPPIPVDLEPVDGSEIFPDGALSYINQLLMEEDFEDKFERYPDYPALLAAAEKPFLEILSEEKHFPESDNHSSSTSSGSGCGSGDIVEIENTSPCDSIEHFEQESCHLYIDHSSHSYFSSANNSGGIIEGDLIQQNHPVEFLPGDFKSVIDFEANGFSLAQEVDEKTFSLVEKEEYRDRRGHKNTHIDDLDLEEERSNKQAAVDGLEGFHQLFYEVLLCNSETCPFRGDNEMRSVHGSHHSKGMGNRKGRRKKQPKGDGDAVDLQTLLIHCAQAVAADDRQSVTELLKQIRQHSSPRGDANQRLAHCFSDGLEARLAGMGCDVTGSLAMKQIPCVDMLKAYQLFMGACPFKRASSFFSNHTILEASKDARVVHIIDYGIFYGFQWPILIQKLSDRPGGPPRIRITGIDLPQTGFRPTERIEDTGRRLADYARRFNVPFEFHAIAANWETIRVEDVRIEKDELLVVYCLYRFRNLMDESVVADSPRDRVLRTIRKMNPDVFIHGVVNGTHSGPFFLTRFREALFYFHTIFDMLEATIPREDPHRMLIESLIYGQEAINVISCEGTKRVERPETYRKWTSRNIRAGFRQLSLNADLVKKARNMVRVLYHKDFVVDEGSNWLLLGWKGRIVNALSTWKPNNRS
ncbi:scarecrow-like protein 14 [Ananas comosus]|uniref:Scarecrow-like protein 14 n=1 Tax=Ananas comosus TaxID=4615 RepID=A0A199W2U0_ANACO|nr:scarecrow-like protein 14 [Ananas comosus]OAY83561.1 Scarecrow-like protein 14 [Ananas comosus]